MPTRHFRRGHASGFLLDSIPGRRGFLRPGALGCLSAVRRSAGMVIPDRPPNLFSFTLSYRSPSPSSYYPCKPPHAPSVEGITGIRLISGLTPVATARPPSARSAQELALTGPVLDLSDRHRKKRVKPDRMDPRSLPAREKPQQSDARQGGRSLIAVSLWRMPGTSTFPAHKTPWKHGFRSESHDCRARRSPEVPVNTGGFPRTYPM